MATAEHPNLFPELPQPDGLCKHCGKPLASWNKGEYCAEHRRPADRVEKRFCADCKERLRSDTPGDRCLQCRLARSSSERQLCKAVVRGEKCKKRLNSNNKIGLCVLHRTLARPSHARAIARKLARKPCLEPGCENLGNQNGFCRRHRYACNRPSAKPQFCKAVVRGEKCTEKLRSDNTHGLCTKHAHRWPIKEPKLCQAATILGPGNECKEVLGANNKSGLCAIHLMELYRSDPEHRAADARRQQEFRARLKQKLAEADQAPAKLAKAQAEVDRLTEALAQAEQAPATIATLQTELDAAKAKLAEAKAEIAHYLPADWQTQPRHWWIIGGELRSQEAYMSNEELAERMEEIKGFRPYGDDWGVITRPSRARNEVSDIRKWVDRPGRPQDRS